MTDGNTAEESVIHLPVAPPAWEVQRNDAQFCLHVLIHGKCVIDATTGEPAQFIPPKTSKEDYERWLKQLSTAITRMSGMECVLT